MEPIDVVAWEILTKSIHQRFHIELMNLYLLHDISVPFPISGISTKITMNSDE